MSKNVKNTIRIIFEGILKTRLEANDNFFNFGLDSLSGISALHKINAEFACSLSLEDLFNHPSLSSFCGLMKNNGIDCSYIKELQCGQLKLIKAPTTSNQKQLWMLDKKQKSWRYNLVSVFYLKGTFNLELFEGSVTYLIKRHTSLRTSFQENKDGEIEQIVRNIMRPNIEIVELTKGNFKNQLQLNIREEAHKCFDLLRDILFRIRILKLSDEEYYIIIIRHHIISDAWSAGIFYNELSGIYNALTKKQRPNLKAISWQYLDYASSQSEWLNTDGAKKTVMSLEKETARIC